MGYRDQGTLSFDLGYCLLDRYPAGDMLMEEHTHYFTVRGQDFLGDDYRKWGQVLHH